MAWDNKRLILIGARNFRNAHHSLATHIDKALVNCSSIVDVGVLLLFVFYHLRAKGDLDFEVFAKAFEPTSHFLYVRGFLQSRDEEIKGFVD